MQARAILTVNDDMAQADNMPGFHSPTAVTTKGGMHLFW
jgi:hypothetical protein